MGPYPFGPKEIDGLLYKAYMLLTGHLITGSPLRSESIQEKWFQSNHHVIRLIALISSRNITTQDVATGDGIDRCCCYYCYNNVKFRVCKEFSPIDNSP